MGAVWMWVELIGDKRVLVMPVYHHYPKPHQRWPAIIAIHNKQPKRLLPFELVATA